MTKIRLIADGAEPGGYKRLKVELNQYLSKKYVGIHVNMEHNGLIIEFPEDLSPKIDFLTTYISNHVREKVDQWHWKIKRFRMVDYTDSNTQEQAEEQNIINKLRDDLLAAEELLEENASKVADYASLKLRSESLEKRVTELTGELLKSRSRRQYSPRTPKFPVIRKDRYDALKKENDELENKILSLEVENSKLTAKINKLTEEKEKAEKFAAAADTTYKSLRDITLKIHAISSGKKPEPPSKFDSPEVVVQWINYLANFYKLESEKMDRIYALSSVKELRIHKKRKEKKYSEILVEAVEAGNTTMSSIIQFFKEQYNIILSQGYARVLLSNAVTKDHALERISRGVYAIPKQ